MNEIKMKSIPFFLIFVFHFQMLTTLGLDTRKSSSNSDDLENGIYDGTTEKRRARKKQETKKMQQGGMFLMTFFFACNIILHPIGTTLWAIFSFWEK